MRQRTAIASNTGFANIGSPGDEFIKHWTGVLLLLTPTARLGDVIKSTSSFSRLYSFVLPHNRLFLDALIAAVLMTILGLNLFGDGLRDLLKGAGETLDAEVRPENVLSEEQRKQLESLGYVGGGSGGAVRPTLPDPRAMAGRHRHRRS